MKRLPILFVLPAFVCLILGEPITAQETAKTTFAGDSNLFENEFDFSAGHRQDSLNWNIAGDINGENPNIISELTWKNLKIYQINIGAKSVFDKKLRLEASYGYGWIYDGDNQDSDYDGDNRTWEWSRSNNKSKGDNVSNWSLGLGYQFNLDRVAENLVCDNAMFTLLGGYSQHNQNLIMTDGYQTIPDDGAFVGLHSTYDAEWKGPWLGAEMEGSKGKITGFIRYEYHWADFYAEANWNLRTDLLHPVSFSHEADGTGNIVTVGTGYNINNNCLLYLKADIQTWGTEKGIIRFYKDTGATPEQMLNRVNWKSTAILIGIRYRI